MSMRTPFRSRLLRSIFSKVAPRKSDAVQLRTVQVRFRQVALAEIGFGQIRAVEVRADKFDMPPKSCRDSD